MTRKRFGVIVNPAAGRGKVGKYFPYLKEMLEKSEAVFKFFLTEAPLHAISIAEKIHKEFDTIVAFGGDGTANEVMHGLAGTNVPFGLIPFGTGNDFARSLRIKKNFKHAVEVLLNKAPRPIDLGTINDRIFINGVGIGFDGYVNKLSRSVKLLKGQMVYYYSIVKGLIKYKSMPLEVRDESGTRSVKTFLLAIGNGFSIGGGLKLTPEAKLDDALFDVCRIDEIPLWKIIANIARLKTGTIAEVKEVEVSRSASLKIASEIPLPIHIDGEVYETNKNSISINNIPASSYVIGNWDIA